MSSPNWNANSARFYQITQDRPPWPLLMRAASLAPDGRRALDLGAGAGRDTRYLLEHGFQVTAVDGDAHAIARLAALPQEHLHVVHSAFEDFAFETYDLINAQFSLPFMPPERFSEVFVRLKAALVAGGVFAGHFFGVHDEWNLKGRNLTFFTRPAAEAQLSDLDLIELVEEDEDGTVADGTPKHWHVYHILARRPN